MTPSRPEPRTVEEKAREIYLSMFGAIVKPEDSLRLEILAAALREYGEAEFKRGCELFADGGYSHGNKEGYAQGCADTLHNSPMYEEGWNDCRERAAKIAEANHDCYEMAGVVQAIRALTPSEGGTK